jgi:hypothetical protein
MRGIVRALHDAHEALADKTLAAGTITAADLTPETQKIAALHQQLIDHGAQVMLKIRAIATPEQLAKAAQAKQKLDALHDEMRTLLGEPFEAELPGSPRPAAVEARRATGWRAGRLRSRLSRRRSRRLPEHHDLHTPVLADQHVDAEHEERRQEPPKRRPEAVLSNPGDGSEAQHRGVDDEREEPERQDGERQREQVHDRSHDGVDDADHHRSGEERTDPVHGDPGDEAVRQVKRHRRDDPADHETGHATAVATEPYPRRGLAPIAPDRRSRTALA